MTRACLALLAKTHSSLHEVQHADQLASNGVLAISSCHFGIVGMELTLQSVVMVIYPPSLYSHRGCYAWDFWSSCWSVMLCLQHVQCSC